MTVTKMKLKSLNKYNKHFCMECGKPCIGHRCRECYSKGKRKSLARERIVERYRSKNK